MALAFTSATGTTSATIPSHAAGDLIVAFAYRDGSNTVPTIPTGQNWTTVFNTTGANTNSHVIVAKKATSSSETTGTFTNATSFIVVVIKSTGGIPLGYKNGASGTAASTTLSYTGFTLDNPASSSKILAFVGTRSVDTTCDVAPTGFTKITSVLDATDEAAAHASTNVVSSFSTTTQSIGGTSSGWRTHTLEVYENPNVTVALTGQAITFAAGTVTPVGGDAPYGIVNQLLGVANSGTSFTTGGSTTGSDVPLNITAGSTVCIRCSFGNASQYPTGTPTDSANVSNVYSEKVTRQIDGSGGAQSVWVCENHTGGSNVTFSLSFAASVTNGIVFEVIELSGVATASYDAAVTASGQDNNSPFTVTSGTPSQADEIIVSFYQNGDAGGGTFAEGSGMTVIQSTNNSTYWLDASAYEKITSASAKTTSWTYTAAGVNNAVAVLGFKKATASGDVTLGLSGSSTTFASGTVVANTSKSISGIDLTSAQGTVTPSIGVNVALSGNQATFNTGTLTPNTALALAGSAITAAGGSISASLSKALSGLLASSEQGIVGVSTVVGLGGLENTFSAGTIVIPGGGPVTVALTGTEIAFAAGTLTASIDKALSGNVITGAQGSVGVTRDSSLGGQAITSEQGSVSASLSKAITGTEITLVTGILQVELTKALAGGEIDFASGTIGISTSKTLNGILNNFSQGVVTPSTPGVAVFPAVGDVRSGVLYGPNGSDYTGTLVTSGAVKYVFDISSGKVLKVVKQGSGFLNAFTVEVT